MSANASAWESRVREIMPLYGHRNWIVVADAAYPSQSNPGIETIVAVADQVQVVRTVSGVIASSKHIQANVLLDQELDFVAEKDAPGVTAYRGAIAELFDGQMIHCTPHEQIITKLDQAAKLFHVLLIKTPLDIPYTSVFFELDCGYWNAEAEARLRAAIAAPK